MAVRFKKPGRKPVVVVLKSRSKKKVFADNSYKAVMKRVMRDFKDGKLRSGGPNGPVVRSSQQALAIARNIADAAQRKAGRYANE